MSEADCTTALGYRKIPNSTGYLVGVDGTVLSAWGKGYNSPTGKYSPLKATLRKSGHSQIQIRMDDGKSRSFYLHHLVLMAFVGPCPKGMECRHLDGDPTNNHLSNLAWGTRQENHDDQIRHGTRVKGERARSAKLTEDQVREARVLYKQGVSPTKIGQQFGVTASSICSMCRGRSWQHIV